MEKTANMIKIEIIKKNYFYYLSLFEMSLNIGDTVVVSGLKQATDLNGQKAVVKSPPFDNGNRVITYDLYFESLNIKRNIRVENFRVIEPIASVPVPVPSHVPSVPDEEYEDEDEEGCSECRDCEFCINNMIKTTGGYEFCEHGCNCHFSKSQLLAFYFKAFNMNEALVEENRVIVVENATLTSENASLKAQIALLEAHTPAVGTYESTVGDAWHKTL